MRILHIGLDKAMGGIESFLLNVNKNINNSKFKLDFIEFGYETRSFEKFFGNNKIFKIADRKKHPIKSYKELYKIIKENNYDVVHIHKNSLADLTAYKICKRLKIKKIIIHSHNSNRDNLIIKIVHYINRYKIRKDKFTALACSDKAGRWLFNNRKFELINNGIDLEKFSYKENVRIEYRKKLNLDNNDFVIGNVGRLSFQKDPLYLLKILIKLLKINNTIKLVWVGDGELKEEIQDFIYKNKIENNVILVGRVDNPEDYYNVFDLFVMPSVYEGFPIAAIEAQANNLKCVLSDSITKEANINENIVFLNKNNDDDWVKYILEKNNSKNNRSDCKNQLYDMGFDIKSTISKLENIYEYEAELGENKK